MSGVEGDAPRLSLGVPKGVFSSEREYPLCLAAAQRAALTHAAPAALQPPIPREGGIKRGNLFEKRVSPFVWQWRSAPHYPCSAARCTPPSPAKEENQKGIPSSNRESPPLSGSSAKSCTNSCSADGAATTHPPQGRLKRDTLFRKRVSPFIFPFPRSAEISVPAPVQDYFLKLSFSVTDRLNTRCSGVQSLLSRQK